MLRSFPLLLAAIAAAQQRPAMRRANAPEFECLKKCDEDFCSIQGFESDKCKECEDACLDRSPKTCEEAEKAVQDRKDSLALGKKNWYESEDRNEKQWQTEKDSLDQQIDSLAQEKKSLTQEKDALAQEKDSLNQQIDSLKQELQTKNQELITKKQEIIRKKQELTTAVTAWHQKKQQLKSETLEWKHKKLEWKGQRKFLDNLAKEEITQLKQQAKDMCKKGGQ